MKKKAVFGFLSLGVFKLFNSFSSRHVTFKIYKDGMQSAGL